VRHGRIDWPTPDELDEPRRALHAAITGGSRASAAPAFELTDAEGRLHGPFNAMLLAPAVGMALQELGGTLRYRTSLTDREREVAILAVAVARRSEFEWYAHERVGRRAGLTDGELDALGAREAADSLSRNESVVHRVCLALLESRDLTDPEHAEAEAALGTEKLAELIVLVGYYDCLALMLQVHRSPLPAGAEPRFVTERA
jgi:4-carboxymuconolactone decarboxylase